MSSVRDTGPRPAGGALHGVRVLDFTTLLPGPLATLWLAEAGAIVLKIEPPGGDPMRHVGARTSAGTSTAFELLNRGKQCRTLDLKTMDGRTVALELARSADVLVEQFRPGVMERLGLGPRALAAANPRLIYCSITGYGQSGPRADVAGHDLNYVAEAGLLASTAARDGAPLLPPTQIADIGGGSWPAIMNVLLALYARRDTGVGCHLDIAMADNVWAFQLMPLAHHWATGHSPAPGAGDLFGGLPRYGLYETRDGRWLAVGALEDRFFLKFAELLGVAGPSTRLEDLSHEDIARRVRQESAAYWLDRCRGADVCVSLVRDVGEALAASPLAAARAFLDGTGGAPAAAPPLPLPLAAQLRCQRDCASVSPAASAGGWPAAGGG
jgi:crotonobetainyl-CoA:carnitine CoA-transferase CaiB-like acyl-CoA transferase